MSLLALLLAIPPSTASPIKTPRQDTALTLHLPSTVPTDASAPVDPDFPGLAFEQASWVRYALDDNGRTNQFTRNLMSAIYSRTGGRPIIRLGGTSPDYGRYLPGQQQPALPVSEQDNYQDIGGTTIGPSYWPIAKLFPEATYMVQVPLATANISESVAWAVSAVNGIGIEQIHSIQPGNEPDLYSNTFTGEGGRYLGPPNYQGTLGNETYVGNYTAYASAIREAVPEVRDAGRFFTAFDVAAHVDDPAAASWLLSPEACFGLGIDEDGIVKEVSQHYYQNNAGSAADLAEGLMTLSLTHRNLDYMRPRIGWLRENRPEVPFIINEIGNSLKVTNSYEYQAVLGSALWALDFYMYALSIGVRRFNYQQIMHSGFDLWMPVDSAGQAPRVFANYYAMPYVADFAGSSGARVAKIEVEGAAESAPNLAAYAAFEGGRARRVAVANLDYWNRTSSAGDRPVAVINVGGLEGSGSVKVTKLGSPDGAGADGDTITYAGSVWSYESLGREVKGVRNDTETATVVDGVAQVRVASSEAVIIYIE